MPVNPIRYCRVIPLMLFLLITSLFIAACSGKYEQHYHDYSSFDKTNQRNKSWFPDIISTDAYDLQSESYLDQLCAFGRFSYKNQAYYDSLLNSTTIHKVDLSLFEEKLNMHIKRKPGWFCDIKAIPAEDQQVFEQNRFYMINIRSEKKIYYILSDGM